MFLHKTRKNNENCKTNLVHALVGFALFNSPAASGPVSVHDHEYRKEEER
jgi:hypothetical protein